MIRVKEYGLTVKEVGELLGVSASTVRDMAHTGEIPHYWVKSLMRFDLADIEEWKDAEKENAWENRCNYDNIFNCDDLDNDDIVIEHWKPEC